MDNLIQWTAENTGFKAVIIDEAIDHERLSEQLKKPYVQKKNKYSIQLLKDIPTRSGVYVFFDELDNLIYVGKASNLRDRVRQHITGNSKNTQDIRTDFNRIGFIRCIEYEAKWIEKELILDFQPYGNQLGVTI